MATGERTSCFKSATCIGSAAQPPISTLRSSKPMWLLRQRVDQFLIHAVSGAQMKFALLLVEDVDRAGVGTGELHRLGDDGGEHGFEIERRVHRLRYLAERAKFLDRAAKLVGALAQLAQQPRIFDGDNGLRGEIRDQRDLLIGEGTHFLAIDDNAPISSFSLTNGTANRVRACLQARRGDDAESVIVSLAPP